MMNTGVWWGWGSGTDVNYSPIRVDEDWVGWKRRRRINSIAVSQ